MEVSTFMTTEPITVQSDASLRSALGLMDQHGIRHLPVMEQGAVVGVLSDRDLLEATGGATASDASKLDGQTAGEVMCAPVVSAHPTDSVVTISVEVVLRGLGCLPVLADGELLGIVTEMDLLRLFVTACREGRLAGDLDPAIATHMTCPVVTLKASDTVSEALRMRESIDIRHLPVVEDQRLVGMVSDRDLRRATGKGITDELSVEEIMVRDLRVLGPEDSLSSAALMMTESKISAIPIVQDGELVGIVSTTDLLDHCMNTLRNAE